MHDACNDDDDDNDDTHDDDDDEGYTKNHVFKKTLST